MGLIGLLYLVWGAYILGVFLLTLSEVGGFKLGQWLAKPFLGFLFLVYAPLFGPFASPYSWFIFIGLIFSFIGDVALLKEGTGRVFILGMTAFFFAHLAYLFGFVSVADPGLFWFAVLMFAVISAALTVRVFEKHLPDNLSKALYLYSFAIAAMLVMALFASVKTGLQIFAIAAILFVISDMAVGQHRFVSQNPKLFFIITPFYFAAQGLFAISINHI